MDWISAAPDALPTTAQSACGNAPDLVEWTATALSQAIHARQVSCVQVLEAYLAQIDRLNPIVNALVAPVGREGLRAQAQERDAQLARGISLGPLHGFPQAAKDIMPVAGMVTTRG